MARSKGLTLADIKAFVREEGGDAALSRFRAALAPADRALLDEVVAVGWYPFDAYVRLLEAVPVALEREPRLAMRQYGRFAAQQHVSRLYRVLFLALNPALMLEKVSEYWSRFADTGHWQVTRETDHRARGDLVGLSHPHALHCEFLASYITAIFERIGARDPRCTHPRCRTRGDSACTFVVEWR